ncbi:hypothetical protein DITRI_Ditri19aG0090100 [Diplodiscus trichospermus]
MEFVAQLGFMEVIVEGDAQTIITGLQAQDDDISYIGGLLAVVREQSIVFSTISFHHIRREGNKAAHDFAKNWASMYR